MAHAISAEDRSFQADFESARLAAGAFDHRAHLRLAYVYLVHDDAETAHERMRQALHGFLGAHGVDASKYHDTMTRAWILAVRHFMYKTDEADCADAFIDAHPEMLDTRIMLTHYSADLLFSPQARQGFVEPDLDPIPRYDSTPRTDHTSTED